MPPMSSSRVSAGRRQAGAGRGRQEARQTGGLVRTSGWGRPIYQPAEVAGMGLVKMRTCLCHAEPAIPPAAGVLAWAVLGAHRPRALQQEQQPRGNEGLHICCTASLYAAGWLGLHHGSGTTGKSCMQLEGTVVRTQKWQRQRFYKQSSPAQPSTHLPHHLAHPGSSQRRRLQRGRRPAAAAPAPAAGGCQGSGVALSLLIDAAAIPQDGICRPGHSAVEENKLHAVRSD